MNNDFKTLEDILKKWNKGEKDCKEIDILLDENMEKIKKGIIPDSYIDMEHNWNFLRFDKRQKFIEIQGYALVSMNWISCLIPLLKDKVCLEIMAGQGVISYALREQGINIVSTDNLSWGENFHSSFPWEKVENLEATKAIEKYNPDFVIMSWCPYNSNDGYKSLLKMREINPKAQMIVIGEGRMGCTADNDFFDAIDIIESEHIDLANNNFASWMGIHDRIVLVK